VRKPLHNGNQVPCLVQSPALLFDAVRRLEMATVDCPDCPTESRSDHEGGNILRIMTNLLTFSQLKSRGPSDLSKLSGDRPPNYSLLPSTRSTVFVSKSTNITESKQKAASAYVYSSTDVATICQTDANSVRAYGQYDQEPDFLSIPNVTCDDASLSFPLTTLVEQSTNCR
jgi:WD repeat-containing protein 59